MAEKFGRTWWGEQWLQSLKNVDYGNRLPRGAIMRGVGMRFAYRGNSEGTKYR